MSLWRKDILGWSLYDFANTIYSMNIVTLYLKRYFIEDLNLDDRWFDIPFSISMLLAAVLLPALGAISDHSSKKRIFLFLFTLTCCIATGLIALVPSSMIFGIVFLFIIANFSYEAGMPFYNSLLYTVSDGRQARLVSGFGVALGYVGAILGIMIIEPFVLGTVAGFEIEWLAGWGKIGVFIPTAGLFLLFSIPVYLWVKEKKIELPGRPRLKQAYQEVWDGLRDTKKYPGVLRFLIADYFFEDAVATVIINIGLYCATILSMTDGQIHTFLIISTVTAVIGSFLIGRLAQVWRLKPLLQIIMTGWVICLLLFVFIDDMTVVWILGSVVGVLMGGLWTTTRPFLAELVPKEELGRFFGLFSLSGRAAAVIGPLIWTTVVYFFSPERAIGRAASDFLELSQSAREHLPYKMGLLSLALMILIGLFIFRKLKDRRAV